MASGIEAFSLYAKLILDSVDYEKGLNAAESKAHSIASGVGHGLATLGGAAGKAVAGLAKATAAGVAAASAGVVALTKAAVSSYADYEQLVGGVQTLFGLGGQSLEEYAKSVGKSAEEAMGDYNALIEGQMTVLANADNAYKTAGLSANEYMETVTSFSAALIASLDGDTAAAANKADMAITDMSDNANKMGSSMESIQNAYQGFAKQNYTMLDNLKLGYGGTKEEMQRLLKDAEKLSGQKFDLTSYSDIVDAIHVVQTEMGITGTTAKEATETISGSLNMAKAAWQNLVTGLADSQYDTNIKALVENLVNSIVGYTDEAGNHVKGVLDNILPAVEAALEGIATLIGEAVPKLVENLPTILNTVLPVLIEAAINLVNGLVAALPTVIQLLLDQIPMILDTIIQTVVTLAPVLIGALVSLIGEIVAALPDLITQSLLDLFLQIGQMIAENLPSIMESITNALIEIANVITDPANLENFINTAIDIINALVEGLTKALPQLIPAIVDVVLTIVKKLTDPDTITQLVQAAAQIIMALAIGLVKAIPQLIMAIPDIIIGLVTALNDAGPAMLEAGLEMMDELGEGILEGIIAIGEWLGEWLGDIFSEDIAAISEAWDTVTTALSDSWEQVKERWSAVGEWFGEKFSSAKETISGIWDTVTTSIGDSWEQTKERWSNIGEWFGERFTETQEGISERWNLVTSSLSDSWEQVKERWSNVGDWFSEKFTDAKEKSVNAWSNIKERFTTVKNNMQSAFNNSNTWFQTNFTKFKNSAVNAWSNIKEKFSEIKEKIKEGLDLKAALQWGKDLINNFIAGLKAKWEALKDTVKSIASSIKSFLGFSEPSDGPLSNFHTYAPDMMDLFMQGIEDNKKKLQDTVANAFNFQPLITSPEMGALGSESTQTWNINIYQPMESAADVARAIREESQYGLIGGDGLAT